MTPEESVEHDIGRIMLAHNVSRDAVIAVELSVVIGMQDAEDIGCGFLVTGCDDQPFTLKGIFGKFKEMFP